jgi:hypothetical protein
LEHNTSGVNTSSFTWSTNGHTGSRSLRTNVTAFTSGDAKWWFNPVAVSPNTTYTYSYWSRSTVDSQLLVEFGNGTSNVSVVWLATMPASPGVWTQRTQTFTTLADTVTVTVYHALETVGVSEIDDASLPSAALTPSVTVTAPTAGAVVSGAAVALSASTTGTGILGVQFKVDGANVGAEDTTTPYGVTWNSTAVADGSHAVSATARTAATSTTSTAVSISVTNSTAGQLVANPSMESGTTTPTSWNSGVFGVNTSTFTWSTNGHTGDAAAEVAPQLLP